MTILGRNTASMLFLTGTDDPSAIPTHLAAQVHELPRPKPLSSLVASAHRLTSSETSHSFSARSSSWQEDAWDMFDLVGEERFLATTLAGRLAQAPLYIGRLPEDPTDDPEQVDNDEINAILDSLGGTPAGRNQMILRLAINLFVAGDGWLVGMPRHLVPGTHEFELSRSEQTWAAPTAPIEEYDLRDLEWRTLSVSEVESTALGRVQIKFSEGRTGTVEAAPEELWMIRVWRPHPRRSWEADSPTRASLPVLKELVALTMDVSAQVDSRLAGAGLLIVPQSAQRAVQVAAGILDTDMETDAFTEALMEAMLTPIQDRANASALVPLVVTVPDDAADKFHHIQFGRSLDASGAAMREEAIRRLALGQDAPPELLLGTGGMNHWGAWLVREDVVTTHIEPPLALICDALTTQFLWPVLEEMGVPDHEQYVVWYSIADLIARPNRSEDAKDLHSRGAINDVALRRETGFDESDAPEGPDKDLPIEVVLALNLVKANPTLLGFPGLPKVVRQFRAVLFDEDDPEAVPPVPPEMQEPTAPESDEGPTPGVADAAPPIGGPQPAQVP